MMFAQGSKMDAQGNDTQHLLANLYTEAEQADLYDIQNLGADVLAELFPTSSEECSAVADILDIALGEMSIAPEDAKDTQVSKACEMSDHVKNWMNPGTQANKENIPAKKHRPDAPSIIPQWHTASLMNYNPTPASELIQPVPRYANPSVTRVNPELSVFKPQNGRPRYDSLLPISELDEDQSLSVEYNTTSAGRCKPRPPPLKPQNGGVREDYNTASFARINPGLGPLTRQDGSGGYEALSAVSAMVECPNSDRSVGFVRNKKHRVSGAGALHKVQNRVRRFIEGLPKTFIDDDLFPPDKVNLTVVDDLMEIASENSEIEKAFTKYVHHRNLSILYLVQNVFCQDPLVMYCKLSH
ncbi:uncharacterized protein [Eleutherodactylus coqui]|uniref:uncharacterized protein n=1 Tax=Eleutherodactylus coqui TaxID=57060 RepID=UPI0034618FB2